MIGFANPLLLLAIPALGAILWFFFPRHRRQHLLRFIAVVAVLVALAEPQVTVQDSQEYLVFLIDHSASVRRTSDVIDIERQIQLIMEEHPSWLFGVVGFGESARAIITLGDSFSHLPVENKLDDASRLDKAIELGLAMMPANGANRLLLLSDGQFHGESVAGVTAAQLAGVPISVLPIGSEVSEDVRMSSLTAPSEVPSGQSFELRAGVSAQESTPASLAIYRNDELLSYDPIALALGTTSFILQDELEGGGFAEYAAVVKRDNDAFPENDTRSVLVQTVDKPSVLLIDRNGATLPALLRSIGVAHVTTDTVPDLAILSTYKQVILSGLPLIDLTGSEATAIEHYVKSLGGGLLVIQGEAEVRGFSSGPIDEIMPISYSAPEKERDPSLAIIYLLDRSQSMRELVELKAKIRILREATAASVFLLPADALVGLIGFSDDHEWLYPLQPVGDATEIYAALQNLRATGGTSLYDPLLDAVTALIATNARVKHLLLLSDGKTIDMDRDYPGLMATISEQEDLTLSAIALGEDPNLALLSELAAAGGGLFMHVVDYLTLPQATMDITQRLGNSRFITGDIIVSGPLATGADYSTIPPLSGYVFTYPKAPSSVLLAAGEDPIAATWHIGLGTVTVLNTDLSGAWSEAWLRWPEFSRVFDRLLATTEPLVESSDGFFPSVTLGRDSAEFLVDARSETGGFANFLHVEATLLPDGISLQLQQVAPGIYKAQFPITEDGGYAINIVDQSTGRSARYSFSVPYALEYQSIGRNETELRQIASATGGAVLPEDALEDAVRSVTAAVPQPLFPWLLLLALVLFLIDLAFRKTRFRRLPTLLRNTAP